MATTPGGSDVPDPTEQLEERVLQLEATAGLQNAAIEMIVEDIRRLRLAVNGAGVLLAEVHRSRNDDEGNDR
jgi:methyl coenzyme M reductase beta subunit